MKSALHDLNSVHYSFVSFLSLYPFLPSFPQVTLCSVLLEASAWSAWSALSTSVRMGFGPTSSLSKTRLDPTTPDRRTHRHEENLISLLWDGKKTIIDDLVCNSTHVANKGCDLVPCLSRIWKAHSPFQGRTALRSSRIGPEETKTKKDQEEVKFLWLSTVSGVCSHTHLSSSHRFFVFP